MPGSQILAQPNTVCDFTKIQSDIAKTLMKVNHSDTMPCNVQHLALLRLRSQIGLLTEND